MATKPRYDNYIPDDPTLDALINAGVMDMTSHPADTKNLPSTAAGLPGLMVRNLPYLQGTNTNGMVISSQNPKNYDRNRGSEQTVFQAPDAGPMTTAHELEHLLARQNLGSGHLVGQKFGELIGKDPQKKVAGFLSALQEAAPYLQSTYKINNAYMDPKFIGSRGASNLHEILATLGGIEAAKNVDLTNDPNLRNTLFKDRDVREAYRAVTGLRQTRLDPRDIPPYTRIHEPGGDTGTVDKLKSFLGL